MDGNEMREFARKTWGNYAVALGSPPIKEKDLTPQEREVIEDLIGQAVLSREDVSGDFLSAPAAGVVLLQRPMGDNAAGLQPIKAPPEVDKFLRSMGIGGDSGAVQAAQKIIGKPESSKRVVLKFEWLGQDPDSRRRIRKKGIDSGKNWVALITGMDPRYQLQREFLRPMKDYTESNSKGSRGIWAYYFLREGSIYEVSHQESWSDYDRYFCRVENGKIIRMNPEKVVQWLEDHSA